MCQSTRGNNKIHHQTNKLILEFVQIFSYPIAYNEFVVFSYFANRIYLNLYRRYYNMPPGLYGVPLIGQAMNFLNPFNFLQLGPNRCAISIRSGSTHFVCINDPYLMKTVYADSRTVDS